MQISKISMKYDAQNTYHLSAYEFNLVVNLVVGTTITLISYFDMMHMHLFVYKYVYIPYYYDA